MPDPAQTSDLPVNRTAAPPSAETPMEPPPAPPPPADKPPDKGGLAQKMDKHRTTRNTGAATPPRNDLSRRQAIHRDNPMRNPMGTLQVTIGVSDSQGRQFEELDVTVDTGSTYTAVPRAMLQKLGIQVERSLPSETADGRIVPVDVGEATIRLQGLQFHTPVIFAEENEPSLLGVVSLEQAALAVDPLAGRLIPTNLLRL